MSAALLALQGAVVARLNGDGDLVALLGGEKSFEHAPAATQPPFIAFEELRAREAGTSSGAAHELRVALLCVSRQPGTREALRVAERAAQLLDGASFALDGHRLVNLTANGVEILRTGHEPIRKARLSLRALVEPI